MGIAPGLTLEEADTLALLRQLFVRSGSTNLVRYGLAFTLEEEALAQGVLDRLAGESAIQPQCPTSVASPFQLATVARVQGEDRSRGSLTPVIPPAAIATRSPPTRRW